MRDLLFLYGLLYLMKMIIAMNEIQKNFMWENSRSFKQKSMPKAMVQRIRHKKYFLKFPLINWNTFRGSKWIMVYSS